MTPEQVRQVDLVGAAQDRCGVVHHHQPFALGFLGEAVGVIVDTGGFADQQTVVFGNPRVVLAFDQLDVDAQRPADPDEIIQRLGV